MKRIFTACVLLCVMNHAWAKLSTTQPKGISGTYFSAGGGVLYPNIDSNHTIPTGQGWPDDQYVSNQTVGSQGYFFLAGGYTWVRQSDFIPYYSLGARYTYVAPMQIKGYINQYSLPQFRNYNYQYSIQQQNLLAMFKADLLRWKKVMPFITVGAGISVNNAYNYKEMAYSGITPRVSPGFTTNSNTNFAYVLGGGFDFIMTKHLLLNLEYNYGNFGTVKTGNGANTSTLTGSNFSNTSLKNKLTGNMVQLGVTYYLG